MTEEEAALGITFKIALIASFMWAASIRRVKG
jgi:hypothetical protein